MGEYMNRSPCLNRAWRTPRFLWVGAAAAAKGRLVQADASLRGCRRSYIMTGEYVYSAPVNRALAAT